MDHFLRKEFSLLLLFIGLVFFKLLLLVLVCRMFQDKNEIRDWGDTETSSSPLTKFKLELIGNIRAKMTWNLTCIMNMTHVKISFFDISFI